jgi:lipopolysaccharide transport system ATP-binding protein
MYVRLAFAVAAHLEPEILIVDEVLAVGDAVFQDKCLCKMRDVAEGGGRTVLFVSHNMNAIQSLCQRCLVIQHGRIDFVGIVSAAVDHYLKKPELILRDQIVEGCKRSGTGEARVISVRLETDDGSPQTHFRMGEPLNIFVTAEFPSEIRDPTFGVNIVTDSGIMVADCRSSHYGLKTGPVVGLLEYRMRIEQILLYPRAYALEPWVADSGCLSDFDWVRDAARFVVTSDAEFRAGPNVTSRHGISYIPTTWAATRVSKEAAAVDV